jgi:hypothetical protein
MNQTPVWHVCGTPDWNRPKQGAIEHSKSALYLLEITRADDGNRTRMTSLEGWGSTIELHPRDTPADVRPK